MPKSVFGYSADVWFYFLYCVQTVLGAGTITVVRTSVTARQRARAVPVTMDTDFIPTEGTAFVRAQQNCLLYRVAQKITHRAKCNFLTTM